MKRYILRRLLIMIPTIFIVSVLIYSIMELTPGDPAIQILGDTASEEELAEMREYLGLDQPYIVRLGQFLKQLYIDRDLGESWVYRTNITDELANRMPRTFAICVYSVLVSALIGIPLGVMAAVHQNGIADKIILVFSSVMMCMPGFCIALLLLVTFSLRLGWFPSFGIGSFKHYILPCFTIMITSFAGIARQMRSSMLEVIRSDFVTAARAQGFSKNSVNYRHALPNALIPIVTIMGTHFAGGLGGTMILETVFSIPGVGSYVQGGITNRDRPVVTGCVVFLAILFCVIMLCIDIAYAAVDPRIRAQYEERSKKKTVRRRADK